MTVMINNNLGSSLDFLETYVTESEFLPRIWVGQKQETKIKSEGPKSHPHRRGARLGLAVDWARGMRSAVIDLLELERDNSCFCGVR